MEKMPYQPAFDSGRAPMPAVSAGTIDASRVSWRDAVPTLTGSLVTLRELRVSDAPALFAALTTEQVARFISPPPPSIAVFEKFIAWTHRQREAGQYVCFAVVPRGSDTAVGLFQVRALDMAFGTAEWGFAIASEFWGSGLFLDSARAVIEFSFTTLGVHRLEARAAVKNGRGNAALRKVGAIAEGVLRRSFLKHGEYLDQMLWALLRDEWLDARAASAPMVRSVH